MRSFAVKSEAAAITVDSIALGILNSCCTILRMQTPPAPSQKKKSNTGLIVGLIIAAVVICCVLPIAGLVGFGFLAAGQGAGMIGCTISMSALGDSLRAYTLDHDGKLPTAKDWQTQVAPYLEKELSSIDDPGPFKVFDPKGEWGCDEKEYKSGVAFNTDFSGKNLKELKDQTQAVILFETKTRGKNVSAKYVPLKHSESPGILGGIIGGEKRGWFVVTADGLSRLVNKNGQMRSPGTPSRSMKN